MKKLISTVLLFSLILSLKAQSKSIEAIKNKHKGNEEFFHLELGGNFLNFAEGFKINLDKGDMATVAKSIEKLNFFTLPDGSQSVAEYKSLQKGLEKEKYDLLMEAGEWKSGLMIYGKGARTLSDLVILLGDEKKGNLILVELKGSFTQEMLTKAKNQLY
jgi:hypothetical protein